MDILEKYLNGKHSEITAYAREMRVSQMAKSAKGISREALEALKIEGFEGYFFAQPDLLRGIISEVYMLGQKSADIKKTIGKEEGAIFDEAMDVIFDVAFGEKEE